MSAARSTSVRARAVTGIPSIGCAVLGAELTRAMDLDARTVLHVAGSRDVCPSAVAGLEFPERRGASVAQHGPGPAGEDRGQPVAPIREVAMADREHADVKAMEPRRAHAVGDRALTKAHTEELPVGDHSVLAPRHRRELGVVARGSDLVGPFVVVGHQRGRPRRSTLSRQISWALSLLLVINEVAHDDEAPVRPPFTEGGDPASLTRPRPMTSIPPIQKRPGRAQRHGSSAESPRECAPALITALAAAD